MTVEYRDVARFPGYRVGDDGSVWSLWKRVGLGRGKGSTGVIGGEWKRLRPVLVEGYPRIGFRCGSGIRRVFVHQIVLEAFVGQCPPGLECLHEDGDRANCRRKNLRYGTHQENAADMIRHGRCYEGPPQKLPPSEIAELRNLRRGGMTFEDLAKRFGVTPSTAHRIVNMPDVYESAEAA